ncbi:TonB-dependent receptor plug domain-containing protein [Flavobacterium columnare]|uniref:TonB-dependent receptor plug domain-containing protein n=1 Tax=Flavobacterium columnare TaxID=996 RepID=UPI002D79526D|nr:TonB-dependent receptor [Flavobacterium columnare]
MYKIIMLVLFVFSNIVTGQIDSRDSLRVKKIDEVVITGQFTPQSLKKSVFNVRVITSKDIQNLSANNFTDVLNQYLNISLQPSGSSGRSTVSLFGLDGQYFKILVDNVPLINENGLGNNIDLSQINLNDIERIEIVEGSMGVTHGANTVTGVLNIITKKKLSGKFALRMGTQEETIGKEFQFFDKGRHIQNLKLSYNYKGTWYFDLGINRNDFKGFYDTKQGKFYSENDGTRGLRWLPKVQLNGTTTVVYHTNNFDLNYKLEMFNELVRFYNSTVQSGYNDDFGYYRYANDKRYFVNRIFHNLNLSGRFFSKINYTGSFSYQKQERKLENFKFNLYDKNELNNDLFKDQSMEVYYSTGSLSNFFNTDKADLLLGYEIVSNKGFSLIQKENNVLEPIEKRINNYDFYVSSELSITDKFSIKPGLRFSIQSLFQDQYASSLALRHLFNKGVEMRLSYGTSYRTPNFTELYSKQIFDGHFFSGNEKLIPETSTSYEASLKRVQEFKKNTIFSNQLSTSFIDLKDKIDMVLSRFNPDTGNPEYQYINISKYSILNIAALTQLKNQKVSASLGASLVGISQKIDNQVFSSNKDYLYSFNCNASLSYSFSKPELNVSLYYKYNGRVQQLIEGATKYEVSTVDSSNWLDFTLQKKIFKGKVETSMGARNILNITNINQSGMEQSRGHARNSQLMLAYGRSFFVKIVYNLKF